MNLSDVFKQKQQQPIVLSLEIDFLGNLLVPCKIGGVQTLLQVDTASDVNVLSRSLLGKVRQDFEKVGKNKFLTGNDRIESSAVHWGTITFFQGKREISFSSHFYAGGEQYGGENVTGIIGKNLLRFMVFTYDGIRKIGNVKIFPET